MKLVSFDLLPLGTRFRYPGSPRVYCILEKRRLRESEPMEGTICDHRPDLIGHTGPMQYRQGLYTFKPEEALQGVIPVD